MKKKISLNIIDESETEKVITIAKDIGNISTYELMQQQNNFVNNESKQLENAVDMVIREFLDKYGLYPDNNSPESLKKVFNDLKNIYGKKVTIKDLYYDTDEKKVSRANGRTTIIDRYNVIQQAVLVKIESAY